MANKETHNDWLWITNPEFYEDDDGRDRSDLRPGTKNGWWTCAKNTMQGDLALIWRTAPKSDIGYIVRAESDAYPLNKDEFAVARGWQNGCDYRVIYKFKKPRRLQELREDGWLREEWPVLGNGGLQGKVKAISPVVWTYLLSSLRKTEGKLLSAALEKYGSKPRRNHPEKRIENQLKSQPQRLGKILDIQKLALWSDGLAIGQQMRTGDSGVIDLLFCSKDRTVFVVVELKAGTANREVFGQVTSYMGWVKKNKAKGKSVKGVIVASHADAKLENSLLTDKNVIFVSHDELGLT